MLSRGLRHSPRTRPRPTRHRDRPAPRGTRSTTWARGIKDEAKKVGKKLDQVGQGIKLEAGRVTSGVAQEFEVVRSDVQKLPLHHRVYSRIHWDKMLHDAKIQVHMLRDGVVLLRGTVPPRPPGAMPWI